MSTIAVFFLMMVAAGGVAYALIYPMLSGEVRAEKRRKQHVATATEKVYDRDAAARQRRGNVAQSLKELEAKEKERTTLTLETRLMQAGLDWDRKKFYMVSVVMGIVTAFVLFLTTFNPIMILVGFFVGSIGLPRWFIQFKKNRRIKAFVNEFPNAIDVITRGIKAGLPLGDCMRIIANEGVAPVGPEFRIIMETQALGVPLSEAVAKLYDRMPCAESNFFGIVLAIQQKTGGNLSETLANLSKVVRERRKMRDKIQAVSMEAKASAAIIGSLPFVVTILVYLTSPKYIELLFITNAGKVALVAGGIWMLLGILTMRKMINFDI
ncbi:MAG: type II secretion system F family protein [Bosea sp. (in: a-proteobacteria)]